MNKQVIAAIGKLSLAIILLTTAGLSAQGANLPQKDSLPKIKYLGTAADGIVFDVSYENPAGAKFLVTVTDETGTTLYQEVYSAKQFDKKFKLPNPDKTKVTFEIRNYKDVDVRQTFDITPHFTEDVVVTTL